MHRLWARWRDYWLAPGGRISAAMLRIAIAISLLWMLDRIASNETMASTLYYRVGIWMLYPGRPGPELLHALALIAWISTAMLLIGAWTRIVHVISLISVMALAAYAVSDLPTWSHTDVPPLLASLALLGARSGDALSVDAWWRGRRGRALSPAPYQASVRLVQVTVAAIFFIAGYCKVRAGGPALGWALSDNLRNQLLLRFDWIGVPRTAVASWMLGASWRYELFALLNLMSQLTPIAAIFLVRRPIARALLGAFWCTEVVGLGIVMDLWDLHWLPLAAAFVDWDALAAWLRRRRREPEPAVARAHGRWAIGFATSFLVFFVVQAFWLNQRLNAYPFSSFPMFATIRAKRPYGTHQTYEIIGGRLEVTGARPLTADELDWISSRGTYRWMWRERRPDAMRENLQAVLDETRQAFPTAGITSVRMWLAVFQAPAYPAPAELVEHDVAVVAELDATRSFHTAFGELAADGVTVTLPVPATRPDLDRAQLFAVHDDLPDPVTIAATPTATGFVLAEPLRDDPSYVLARPAGSTRSWLVAERARRGY